MFTGIVEGIGKVEKISKNTKNRSIVEFKDLTNSNHRGKGCSCLSWYTCR